MSLVQRYNGICYGGEYYSLLDVAGDGNCMYNAIFLSEYPNVEDHMALRTTTMSKILEWHLAGNLDVTKVFDFFKTSADGRFSQWIAEHQRSGVWGTTMVMCFVSMVHSFNIKSINNSLGGFVPFDAHATLIELGLEKYVTMKSPAVCIYHHVFRQVYTPCINCNHFALMAHQIRATRKLGNYYFLGGSMTTGNETICIDQPPSTNLEQPIIKQENNDSNKRQKTEGDSESSECVQNESEKKSHQKKQSLRSWRV